MDLKKERESLIAQRDNAYSVYQQTIGAIALIDHLIEEESKKIPEVKDHLTLNEFKDMVGATEAEIVPVEQ